MLFRPVGHSPIGVKYDMSSRDRLNRHDSKLLIFLIYISSQTQIFALVLL